MEIDKVTELQLPHSFTSRAMNLDDASQAVELYNEYSQTYLGYKTDTLEDDLVYWQTPGFNLATDTCVVFNNQGRMVAVSEFWDLVEPHIQSNVFATVHPAYENLGIGSYLLAWADRRAQAGLKFSPSGAKVVMQQGVDSRLKKSISFLQNHGFKLVRNFYHMHIELSQEPPQPIVPDGFEIRPYQGEDERREMLRALWESFKDHWGFVEEPFEQYLGRWMHWAENMKNMDPSLWYVAVKDGLIAGGSLCTPDRPEDPDMGWINMLGVRRAYRKKGLGLAMLQAAFADFYRRGKKRAGLGVDADSLTGALALYERAGMRIAMHKHSFQRVVRDGVDLSTQELDA